MYYNVASKRVPEAPRRAAFEVRVLWDITNLSSTSLPNVMILEVDRVTIYSGIYHSNKNLASQPQYGTSELRWRTVSVERQSLAVRTLTRYLQISLLFPNSEKPNLLQ